MAAKELRINNRIRINEVRLIDEKGDQLGVVPIVEAMRRANEVGLDLVEVSPNANRLFASYWTMANISSRWRKRGKSQKRGRRQCGSKKSECSRKSIFMT